MPGTLLRRFGASTTTRSSGAGLGRQHLADTAPTTADLDAAAPGRAVYLSRVDAHSALCSTPLRAATPD
ncbi:hypothetical protein GS584_23010 [Rhodococcus hoagii]|nr:hypothetical protein [Prescottella equi]